MAITKVWKQVKKLPSSFGFYPKGTEVRFTPMTTKEIEILNEGEVSSKTLFEYTLEGIKTEKIQPEDLTFDDFTFIGLQRRLYSQTEILCTLKTHCPKCGKEKLEEFNFNEISFEEPKEAQLLAFELNDYIIEYGPLTIGSMMKMLNSDNGVNAIDTLAYCIRDIHPKDSQVQSIYSFELAKDIIENTWGEDRQLLAYVDSLQAHGLQPRKIKCLNKEYQPILDENGNQKIENGKSLYMPCDNVWEEDLGSVETLIFPSSRNPEYFRNKIHAC